MILDLSFIPSVSVTTRNVKFLSTVYRPQNISCLNRIYPDFTARLYFTSVLEELALEIGVLLSFVVVEFYVFNPLKPELNPICYLLALLGAHHFLHVSRIRVKSLTFRLLMS